MPSPKVALTLLIGILVAAGAAAAAAVSISAMTLHRTDLPPGFDQQSSHRLTKGSLNVPGAVASDYVTGWQRTFIRLQGVDSELLTSSALRYADGAAAHRSLRSIWRNTLDHTGAKRLTVGRPLGVEARAFVYETSGGLTTYAIAWRYKNIDGTVLLVGLRSIGVTAELATRLAVQQQRNMLAARG